jgi:carboxypeptidase family protein
MNRARAYHRIQMLFLYTFAVLALATLVAACGISSQNTSSTPTPHGRLNGVVVAGPSCPVERAETPCPPKPVPSRKVTVKGSDGQVVAATTTDAQGHFGLDLESGTYTVQVAIIPGSVGLSQVTPGNVTIIPGQTTNIQIELDTGIR